MQKNAKEVYGKLPDHFKKSWLESRTAEHPDTFDHDMTEAEQDQLEESRSMTRDLWKATFPLTPLQLNFPILPCGRQLPWNVCVTQCLVPCLRHLCL